MKTNVIHCGECADVMQGKIADDSIDLVVTSPPYDNLRDYQGYEFDFESIAQQLWRVIKPGGVVVWVCNDQVIQGGETLNSFRQALFFQNIGFLAHDTMIYYKNGMSFPEVNRYYPVFEYMFVFSKGIPRKVNLIKDRKTEWSGSKKQAVWNDNLMVT